MNVIQGSTVVAAAFTAGALNSVAGGGTLVSFPALLGIGLTGHGVERSGGEGRRYDR
jgi:uncharacterized membrane protein YfcA